MRRCIAFVSTLQVLAAASCSPTPNPAADQAAIQAVDSQMVAALNARDLDRWLSFVSDDARMMPPNAPTVQSKAAIRQMLGGLLSLPNFSVTHYPAAITVARSGDLAYVSYAYELTVPGAAGASITEKGKDISVFQKRPDGTWALVVDMWNPDQPPP